MHITRVCERLPRLQIQFLSTAKSGNSRSKIRFRIRRKEHIPMMYHDLSDLGLGSLILIRIIP